MRVRKLLSSEPVAKGVSCSDPIACQFSSLSSLPTSLRDALQTSFNSSSRRMFGAARGPLRVVFPTEATVRNSLEGWFAGDAIPCRSHHLTPDVRKLLWRWECPLSGRQRAAPHIKTFCRFARSGSGHLGWVVLSSHNISAAAWGQLSRRAGRTALVIKSYELGVMHRPSAVAKARGCATVSLRSLFEALSADGTVPRNTSDAPIPFPPDPSRPRSPAPVLYVPLPHVLPASKYTKADEPWAVDVAHVGADQKDFRGGEWVPVPGSDRCRYSLPVD